MHEVVIFLDMDGVTADFFGGMCKVHGLDRDEAIKRLAPQDFWFTSLIGDIGPQEFWRAIDDHGERFWSDLAPLPHARYLYETLRDMAPVYFLSHPSEQPFCASGKLHWLGKHFPDAMAGQHYVLTAHKHFLAGPGRLLVDDGERHCDRFCQDESGRPTGGAAVLFPQRWNNRHKLFDKGLAVKQTITEVTNWYARQERA